MSSLNNLNINLCPLPQEKIGEYENGKPCLNPLINPTEDLSKTPRSCEKVSFPSAHINEIEVQASNRRYFSKELLEKCFLILKNSFPWTWLFGISTILTEQQKVEGIAPFMETREWSTAPIRCMAWHPLVSKLAIAMSDDTIRTHTETGTDSSVLKHKSQKHITSLAWRPYAIDEMAVGCASGVFCWFVDTMHGYSLHGILLKYKNHAPVTSLAWHADGLLLATCSINDSNILLWNVDKGVCRRLKRSGPNCCILRWAPQTIHLLCTTVEDVFCVWKDKEFFKPEHWYLKSERIQSAAWSPCGQILLFVTSNDTKLFRFQEINSSPFLNVDKNWKAVPIVDLSAVNIGQTVIGGLPQSIVWDPSGSFVALSFKETSLIAVFLTKIIDGNFKIYPHRYVRRNDEYPVCMCFQNLSTPVQDITLTVAWSSGFVQFCYLRRV